MNNRICIIIPNWNGIDFLAECLDALKQQTTEAHIVVVDNGSKDGSMELVREKYPDVELLSFSDNAGFAGGVNRGIRPALEQGYDYVALLNNDAVAEPGWIEALVGTLEQHPEAGMATSKIRRKDGNLLDSTGDYYSIWGFPYPRGRDEVDSGQYDDKTSVFGCSGGATLYRAEMLRQIGIFDEAFFAYFEDVDVSFRAQLCGWKALYEPRAVVNHHVGGTSGKISGFARYHTVKNFVYLYTKNMPGRLYWKYLWRFWLALAMMAVSDIKRGTIGAYLKGVIVALFHLPRMVAKRVYIQQSRKVSIDYIDSILIHEMPPTQKAYLAFVGKLRGKRT